MIDVYGHFGTLFSYATVAAFVARLLRSRGLLGNVHNFDPEWHPDLVDLASASDIRSSHLIVFAPPRPYVMDIAQRYGKARSAIFSSPNTDRMDHQHVMATFAFGTVLVPSAWCATSLISGVERLRVSVEEKRAVVSGTEVVQVSLGVSEIYAQPMASLPRTPGDKKRVFHTGTDQGWPGRKGTEELLDAWKIIAGACKDAELKIHVPVALQRDALYKIADLGIEESVTVMVGGERGTSDDELNRWYSWADLVVQPSRCEGFGMMILAAIVRGVPLLTTYVTGQVDFLRECPGYWVPVPTGPMAPLFGEDGLAPTIEPELLAQALLRALDAPPVGGFRKGIGTWSTVEPGWADWIAQWIEETA